jgi:hypothetical protein
VSEAFPLQWPEGRPRTERGKRERSKSRTGFSAAVHSVLTELRLLGATSAVISTNIPLRRDGLPLAQTKLVDDSGAAVYFLYRGKQLCFCCDRWLRAEDNIHAVALTIEALRGIPLWGTGNMLEAALVGFIALPNPDAPSDWRSVLGTAATIAEVERRFRILARKRHPDAGGSHEGMAELNRARDAARAELAAAGRAPW